jgi:hypothetical protein
MFRPFFRSTTMSPNSCRWRGLVKPLLGLLSMWLATTGANQAQARPGTLEQTALEKRVELVRTALNAQSQETGQEKNGDGKLGPVAQWPNWPNWPNYWPNYWRNY